MSETLVRYPAGKRPGTLTYEDYCALPDDGLRYEIIEGRLVAEPSPRRAHQRAVLRLAARLDAHVRPRGLGEVFVAPFDVILGPRTVVVPGRPWSPSAASRERPTWWWRCSRRGPGGGTGWPR